MEKKFLDTYNKCIETWGIESEIRLCVEEMSELTKELMKFFRYGEMECPQELKNHIIEEIADVQNTVDQMQNIFGEEAVNKVRDEKIGRTNKRIEEHKLGKWKKEIIV